MPEKSANWQVVPEESDERQLVIKDLGGPHPSITNDANMVVIKAVAAGLLKKSMRLFYYDSEGQRDEILFDDRGFFRGFASVEGPRTLPLKDAWISAALLPPGKARVGNWWMARKGRPTTPVYFKMPEYGQDDPATRPILVVNGIDCEVEEFPEAMFHPNPPPADPLWFFAPDPEGGAS